MIENLKLPDDWEINLFEKVILKFFDYRGKTPLKLGMDWGNGNILALSANNVEMGRINKEKEAYYASEELYNIWMNKGDLKKEDILMTMEAPLGNITQVPDNKKYILSQRVVAIRTKNQLVEKFYTYFLKSEYFQAELRKKSTGTTALGISQKNLFPLKVFYPKSTNEQKKIAYILQSIEKNIESTEKIIEKYKKIKLGLMSDLLTGRIRIKDGKKYVETEFDIVDGIRKPIDWEVKSLGDVGDFKNGLNKGKDDFGFGIKFVNISDAYETDCVKIDNLGLINASKNEIKTYKLKDGDIVLVRSSVKLEGVGYPVLFEELTKEDIVYCGFMIRYRLFNKKLILPNYLLFLLKHHSTRRKVLNYATKSANVNINQESYKNIKIMFPKKEAEQQAILELVLKQNRLIEKEELYLEKLKKLKAGLMEDLLTGKVRVKY